MSKLLESEREYSDLGLAAALATEGCVLKSIRPISHSRSVFIFTQPAGKNLAKLESDYWSGTLLVPAHNYYQQLRAVKNRLYGEGRL